MEAFQSFILAYKTLLGICIYTTMESSSRGRLGLQQIFPKNFEWKGKTFSIFILQFLKVCFSKLAGKNSEISTKKIIKH